MKEEIVIYFPCSSRLGKSNTRDRAVEDGEVLTNKGVAKNPHRETRGTLDADLALALVLDDVSGGRKLQGVLVLVEGELNVRQRVDVGAGGEIKEASRGRRMGG